jgi:hypothetical protein
VERSRGSWTVGVVDGPLIRTEGACDAGMAAHVGGHLTYDGSMVGLDDRVVIWPENTSWDEDCHQLRLPSGDAVRLGQGVGGGGGFLSVDAVRSLFGDAVADACGDTDQVLVFNPGRPVALSE